MNAPENMPETTPDTTPETGVASPPDMPVLARLLLAYAPADRREWQGLCWQLDQRLAAIIRRGGEPTIAAIRLAWWDDILVAGDRSKGGGEPLVERWRAIAPDNVGPEAEQLIDGWRALAVPELMSDEDLLSYGLARGGGLFGLLARADAGAAGQDQREAIAQAGSLWALWDLAAHVRDDAFARRALDVARTLLDPSVPKPRGRALKPLRLARAIVLPDIRAGRVPSEGFALRHYGRLLRAALRG